MSKSIFLIVLAISISLLLAFSITYFVNNEHRKNFDKTKWQEEWFSQNFDDEENKVFLLGASHVANFNATDIENILRQEGHNFTVYNLAMRGDNPISRQNFIDEIISSDPKVVVYGVGFRDFVSFKLAKGSGITSFQISKPQSLLPDPQTFFEMTIPRDKLGPIDMNNFQNPKFTTFQLIDLAWGKKLYKPTMDKREPFENEIWKNKSQQIRTGEDLVKSFTAIHFPQGYINPNHGNFLAFEKIIKNLKENNIDVIIFSTPHHQLYLDTIPEKEKSKFISIMNSLSDKYQIPVYFLHDKYSNLDIFWNPDHVAHHNPKASFVYEEVGKMILNEIDT